MWLLDLFRYFGEVAISGNDTNPFLYVLPVELIDAAGTIGTAIAEFLF
jgi:hypothetical protein